MRSATAPRRPVDHFVKKLSARERRAYRWGFIDGLTEGNRQLELFRVRVCVRGFFVEVPRAWPTVTRGDRKGAA